MCEQCAAATVDLAEVVPGWKLVRATRDGQAMRAGDYGLVTFNDPDFIFREAPRPEPPEGAPEWDDWSDHADRLAAALPCEPYTGYLLASACLAAGWEPGEAGLLSYWLVDRMGRLLAGLPPDQR